MSIFNRIRDLLSANVNSMLDSAEDPEKMAEEYLRQLNNELYEAKTNVASAMADVEQRLAGQGRLLVRYSGTEPLLRVMIEGKDQHEIQGWAAGIVAVVKEQLG